VRQIITLSAAVFLASFALVLWGCPAEDAPTQTEDVAAEGHDHGEGHDHHHGHGKGHGEGHADSPFHAEGVTMQVENLENGAAVTYTAEDAALVTQLQEFTAKKVSGEGGDHGCKHDCPCKWEGVNRTAENQDNGVKLTLTAEDAETVTRIQEHMAKKAEGGGCDHGKSESAHGVLHSDSVTRTAENLDNGVKMLFTAGCPHLQGKVQEAAAAMVAEGTATEGGEEAAKPCDCPFHAEGVTLASENLENGAAISFTTDNAELVTQLQEHAAKKIGGEGCDCKHE